MFEKISLGSLVMLRPKLIPSLSQSLLPRPSLSPSPVIILPTAHPVAPARLPVPMTSSLSSDPLKSCQIPATAPQQILIPSPILFLCPIFNIESSSSSSLSLSSQYHCVSLTSIVRKSRRSTNYSQIMIQRLLKKVKVPIQRLVEMKV